MNKLSDGLLKQLSDFSLLSTNVDDLNSKTRCLEVRASILVNSIGFHFAGILFYLKSSLAFLDLFDGSRNQTRKIRRGKN